MPDTVVTPVESAAMHRALALAARGPSHGPNPQVGCVLLDPAGRVLGEGWHAGAGTAHAEVAALRDARGRGSDVRGGTAVVTLEPCNHTGRTGPCAVALADAGVARVVYAVPDPSPRASGGAVHLRSRGVDAVGGHLRSDGERLLRVWLHAIRSGRPFVTLKIASSLDGRVAAADGTSRWITSGEARAHAHLQRGDVDAIAIGSGTMLADDPSLTSRTRSGSLGGHQPLRVVVGYTDVPPGARLHGPGGELVSLRTHDIDHVMAALAAREVRHLLVEGGPTLATAFLRSGVVDEVHAYVAPVLLGAGPANVLDLGIGTMSGAVRLSVQRVLPLGPDVLLVATPSSADVTAPTSRTDSSAGTASSAATASSSTVQQEEN
ncbi:MAG: bifunctional diaminohydroxyphosphoribosylaminopyrimidine deaminase/5-amino-6-(5-phosphoribosylamino)uracil reductase RibD [Cellulomonas sp.]